MLLECETEDGEIYAKADNEADLKPWVADGGWVNLADFYDQTGTAWPELAGKWFTVVHGRLFMADDDFTPALVKEYGGE